MAEEADPQTNPLPPAKRPGYVEMLRVFGRIGLLSFGGPAAQIALMHRELVEIRPWLEEQTYLRALSLCMLLPGPEAMQLATYAGWRLRGVPGGLLAGTLFVLPGALVIAGLVWAYVSFGQVPAVEAAFAGIKAAVIVIVLQALLKMAAKALHGPAAWIIAGLAFLAIFALDLPFPLIIASAGIYGFWAARVEVAGPASLPVIHARPIRTLALWLPLWLGPLVMLSALDVPLLADLGWFFAWLAVVTFGGAYAVLAYMTQIVVETYGWITTPQMIAALGLAETTPGPLILVTQFVAMLAGAQHGGAMLALAAGAVALWATFVPCFLWIFLAGPYLDRLAHMPKLSAGLESITAAVVGVILNLSIWFALHVLFHRVTTQTLGPITLPWPAGVDLTAVALTALAGLLLLGLRLGLLPALVAMACAGLASSLV